MFSNHFKLLSFKLQMSKKLIEEYPKNFRATLGTKYSTSLGNLIEAELWDDKVEKVLKQYMEVDVEQYGTEMMKNDDLRNTRQMVLEVIKDPSRLSGIIETLKPKNSKEYHLEIRFMDEHVFGICDHTFTMGAYTGEPLKARHSTPLKFIKDCAVQDDWISNTSLVAPDILRLGKSINLSNVANVDLSGLKVRIKEGARLTSIVFGDRLTGKPVYTLSLDNVARSRFIWKEYSVRDEYLLRFSLDFDASELVPLSPEFNTCSKDIMRPNDLTITVWGRLDRATGDINVQASSNIVLGPVPIGYTLDCYINQE